MFYRITNTIKKIFINEIQELVQDHPDFADILIVNKYQDQEREKINVVIKAASASSQKLSFNNFGLTYSSYSLLANIKGQRGNMIEWVRDDDGNLNNLVPPGFYIIRMIEINEFVIESYLVIQNESVVQTSIDPSGHQQYKLRHTNLNPNSEVILDYFGKKLVRDQHYTIDYENGFITFLSHYTEYDDLRISYQYIEPIKGPYTVKKHVLNNTALPGVVLAFGDRFRQGDIQLVYVSDVKEFSADIYTGRWSMNIDMEVRAQDTDTAERLIDFLGTSIWAYSQEKLTDEGIVITDISLSGESEEPELDVPDEYSFSNTLTLTVLVDWELHKPILGRIEKILLYPLVDTGEETDYAIYQALKTSSEYVVRESFGDRERLGRGDDYNNGSGHFGGVAITANIDPKIIQPKLNF